MRSPFRVLAIVPPALLVALSAAGVAQRSAAPPPPRLPLPRRRRASSQAAGAVLASLDDAGRAKVQFPFEGPQKTRWSNLPSGSSSGRACAWATLTPRSARP